MRGLLLIFLSFLYISASFSASETSAADLLQKPGSPERRLSGKGQRGIKHGANFARGITHGGGGGGGARGGAEGGGANGESGSSTPKGGAAVIPVYAGGAANNNHHRSVHHGSGTRVRSGPRVLARIAAALALCSLFI